MPAVSTSVINKQGYLSTSQVCDELMCGREKVYDLIKQGIISEHIKRGRKLCFANTEISKLKKQMIKNGGAL